MQESETLKLIHGEVLHSTSDSLPLSPCARTAHHCGDWTFSQRILSILEYTLEGPSLAAGLGVFLHDCGTEKCLPPLQTPCTQR